MNVVPKTIVERFNPPIERLNTGMKRRRRAIRVIAGTMNSTRLSNGSNFASAFNGTVDGKPQGSSTDMAIEARTLALEAGTKEPIECMDCRKEFMEYEKINEAICPKCGSQMFSMELVIRKRFYIRR